MFKKLLFLLLTINCSLLTVTAQTQFQRAIGGTSYDFAYSMIRTTDGGYAMAGNTFSFGADSGDYYIVKLDATGNLQWNRAVGGNGFDYCSSIIQITDGGYAVAGFTSSFGAGNYDIYIVKLDVSGTLQWSKTIGGTDYDRAFSIIQTADGGYAMCGRTSSFGVGDNDYYIVKLDVNGNLQWSRTVGGTDFERAWSIKQTTDGGYAVAGQTLSFGAGAYDFYIVKLDASGTLQWSRTVGEIDQDIAYSIIQTTNGGYAVAGITYSFGAGGIDMYIVKLDGSGTLEWSRTVGGTDDDYCLSIIQTIDGGYAVTGSTLSFGPVDTSDMYIVKLDGSGTLQWSKTVGGTNDDYGYSIIQSTDGGYAVAGLTFSFGAGAADFYIVKLDGSGITCGNSSSPSSISGTGGTTTSPTSTVASPTSTVTSPTSLTGTGGMLMTICVIGIQPISNEIPAAFALEQNYPNPFNPGTVISFQLPVFGNVRLIIYDILGKEIETLVDEELKPGTYKVEWNASNYPSGLYIYKLTVRQAGSSTRDFSDSRKMVLMK